MTTLAFLTFDGKLGDQSGAWNQRAGGAVVFWATTLRKKRCNGGERIQEEARIEACGLVEDAESPKQQAGFRLRSR
ncbi:hypothetical protein [Thalassobaculum sp.]|uniref:hypothetical protein n=1 Tax=Thalassobaculum sp. TaxID=2022740 RepID=UPI0032EAAF9E